jgi:peptidyl-prolyl cis-trans isomerase D
VHTSKPFGREGGEGITANRAVVTAAFSQEVLDEGANSTAIELDPETVIVLRAKEHLKPEQLPLEASTRRFARN